MIHVTDNIFLAEHEIQWDFIRSSGPGGQNVNKVATAVQLRINISESQNLRPEVKNRIKKIAGKRMTANGELIITARKFRYQERNREDALERLITIIRQAALPPRRRISTVPSQSVREARLHEKKVRSSRKRERTKKGRRIDE